MGNSHKSRNPYQDVPFVLTLLAYCQPFCHFHLLGASDKEMSLALVATRMVLITDFLTISLPVEGQ